MKRKNKLLLGLTIALVLLGNHLPVCAANVSDNGLYEPTRDDIECLAKVLWNECRGVDSVDEQAAVAWCILNRVDSERWPNTIQGVCKEQNQFAYTKDAPIDEGLLWLAEDVVERWQAEKDGDEVSGRVLPADYYFFSGNGKHNYFRQEYRSKAKWDWQLSSPYKVEGE